MAHSQRETGDLFINLALGSSAINAKVLPAEVVFQGNMAGVHKLSNYESADLVLILFSPKRADNQLPIYLPLMDGPNASRKIVLDFFLLLRVAGLCFNTAKLTQGWPKASNKTTQLLRESDLAGLLESPDG